MDNVREFPRRVIAEVGGDPDEIGVTLAIYGESLEPAEVSTRLGVEPTHAHRNGDKKSPTSRPFPSGAWLLSARVTAPKEAREALLEIMAKVPSDERIWADFSRRFDVKLIFGVHFSGWNKGFEVPVEAVEFAAKIYASMSFDLYAYEEGDA